MLKLACYYQHYALAIQIVCKKLQIKALHLMNILMFKEGTSGKVDLKEELMSSQVFVLFKVSFIEPPKEHAYI